MACKLALIGICAVNRQNKQAPVSLRELLEVSVATAGDEIRSSYGDEELIDDQCANSLTDKPTEASLNNIYSS